MPTILELCGIDFEEDLLSAQSLASVLRGKSDPRTPRRLSAISGLYFEPQSAVIFDDWKYTRFTESGTEALYDMRSDPAEQSSVIDREADALERARRLAAEEKKLARELRRRLRLTSTMERAPLEPEELRRLRSLGYIQ
jgi:arylsulfatase A-like enzyme